MTSADSQVERYDGAVLLLPHSLRGTARSAERSRRMAAEELRLRVGSRLTLLLPEGEADLGGEPVTVRDLELLVENATGASVHWASRQLRAGYLSCRGGYRIGLCGEVNMSEEGPAGFGCWSSAAIRIPRARPGAADGIFPGLFEGGTFRSTLIAAPPGAGKTTLLRELVRKLSAGEGQVPGLRVALCDERGEVAALHGGAAQLDVGPRTDVLDGCPKAAAVMMLLRTMNPQVIGLDEITAPEDIDAISQARNCGVALLATAHASTMEDLASRPLYRPLLEERVFERFVFIKNTRGVRSFTVRRGEAC